MTVQETLQIIEIETFEVNKIGTTQLIDHKTILTTDHIIKIIKTKSVITTEGKKF